MIFCYMIEKPLSIEVSEILGYGIMNITEQIEIYMKRKINN